ncbi:hypothetical protein HPB50_029178 [Hyalomma asiaticum]|nr:hypothetical protein HPB50_029178 [Hyalomma asiaticum]
MVSPRPETENSGYRATDFRRGDLPLQSPPSPQSRESSQSRKISNEKSGDFPESSETRSDVETHASTATWTTEIMPGGGGVQQDGTAGAVSKESSTIEEEQANHYKDELKEEMGCNPEGLASRPTSRYGTQAAMRAKASTHTDKSGCTWGVGTIAEEIASSRMDDPERAQQKLSVAEDSEIKSGSPMANVEAVDAASSRAGDPSDKPDATAESRAMERQSSERGRCSIWSQHISAQPLEAPPEGVGHPVPYTAVAQRLLPILFRERQKTAQTIATETSGETLDIMQEVVAEWRAPGNRTISNCEEELESSAAGTSQDDAERQAETDAPVSQNYQSKTMPSEAEALAESRDNPLECPINAPKETKHMASDFASQTSLEYKLSSPAAVRSLDHEPETAVTETFSQDRRNEPPKPSITVPTDAPDFSSQITAKLPDYEQGQSSRSYIDPAPHVVKRQSISPLNLRPPKKSLIQSRTSAFSIVRKTAFEEQPPRHVEEAASSAELPDDSAEPAVKAEPSVAPVSAGSGMKVVRPVALRAPITAQTASKYVSGATNVSELAELPVGKLTDSASDRDTVPMGDDCSSDTDRTSPCSTLSYSEETEQTSSSSAYESDSSETTDDERGGANESSGSESDITVGDLEQLHSVQNIVSCIYSETSSDSSETSVNGRGGTVDGSGDTTSAVDPESSNTADDKEKSTADYDAARFGAGRASQGSFSEGYVGRIESSGGSPTQGAGDSKTTISLSAEDAEGFGVLRDVETSHNHSGVEAGNAPGDQQLEET